MSAHETITIALLGQPNVGKSTVFNMLTGLDQHVGNWPGKTVDFKIGHLMLGEKQYRLVDLPGTYSLTANSEEELVARDFIIHEKPNLVIVIVNAASLERNLYLVTEVLALDVPLVIGLNMIDVADQQGFKIDTEVLQAALKVPVVPLIASKNKGLKTLIQVADNMLDHLEAYKPRRPIIQQEYLDVVEQIQSLVEGQFSNDYPPQWLALKLLEGDREIHEKVKREAPEIWDQMQPILIQNEDVVLGIARSRFEWIEHKIRAALLRPQHGKIAITDHLDRVATHPCWGLVLLIAIFGFIFFITYNFASPIVDWLQLGVVQPLAKLLLRALENAPNWFSSLVVDGLIGGVGTVLTFLPILLIFFTTLGFLEDVGYLARAAFVMDRFMHLMGLHGRSFLSLFIGFGCNVPAVMGTRIIEDRRSRLLTIFLVPLVPCTARMAVVTFLTPAFFNQYAALVTWLLVLINLLAIVLLGVSINRIIYKGEKSPFIMEMPLYHWPNLRTIGLYVWHNTIAFIKKAGGIIVIFSIIIWTLAWFPEGEIQTSWLAEFGRWLVPFGRLLGLSDWRLIVALLTSFIAKENTIATLGVLFGVSEGSMALTQRIALTTNQAGALSFLVIQMLFIPCVATMAVIKQETASWKFTILSVLALLFISLLAGFGAYQVAQFLGWGV